MKKTIQRLLLTGLVMLVMTATQGQDYLVLSGDIKMTVGANTSFTAFHTFIGEESQLISRGELNLYGILANSGGTSGLVIKADETGYGSLLHYTNGAQATVEQYLTSERWHLVSPPVTNSTIAPYTGIYLKEWQEPAAAWEYLVTPVTLPMASTRGYACWASDALTGPATVTYEGQLIAVNAAMANLALTPGDEDAGWNLAGNPYPCALEWNTNWILNDVGGWAVVYDNGIYKGWNPWMPEGERSYNGKTDGFLAPTQGFWVRAYGENPLVMIPQSARAHKPDAFLKDETVSEVQHIHLVALANEYKDETNILFMEPGTIGFDGLYDLGKHMNVSERPSIYSFQPDGTTLAVQVLPGNWVEETAEAVIPLGFELGMEGPADISATGLESLDPGLVVYLEDLEADVMHDLSAGAYPFYHSENSHPDRFLLHFGLLSNENEYNETKQIPIYSYGNCVYINLPAEKNGTARVFDLTGKTVCSFSLGAGITKQVLPGTGYYVVRAISGDIIRTEKVYISN